MNQSISEVVIESFPVEVSYDLSLEEMIKAGKYDYVKLGITSENFPIKGRGKVKANIELVQIGRDIKTKPVLKNLDTRGLRAATLPELLAFGAAFPEQLGKFVIVALGSVWHLRQGLDLVAYLVNWGSKRELNLIPMGISWGEDCRFAAVRKT